MKYYIIALIVFAQLGCANTAYYYDNNQKVTLKPLSSISRANSDISYYKSSKGSVVGVTSKIIVEFKDSTKIYEILAKYSLSVVNKFSNTLYVVEVSDRTLTIDTSNSLSKESAVDYAHPDFVRKIMSR